MRISPSVVTWVPVSRAAEATLWASELVVSPVTPDTPLSPCCNEGDEIFDSSRRSPPRVGGGGFERGGLCPGEAVRHLRSLHEHGPCSRLVPASFVVRPGPTPAPAAASAAWRTSPGRRASVRRTWAATPCCRPPIGGQGRADPEAMSGYEPELKAPGEFSQAIDKVWQAERGLKAARRRGGGLRDDQAYPAVHRPPRPRPKACERQPPPKGGG
jgi:hypothetical protein